MYEKLIGALKKCGYPGDVHYCRDCVFANDGGTCHRKKLLPAAADAIEKLNRYAAQMDKLREDGWYLLQETAGTYGPITMKMPIPEPLSCDDVLTIINGEPPKIRRRRKNADFTDQEEMV